MANSELDWQAALVKRSEAGIGRFLASLSILLAFISPAGAQVNIFRSNSPSEISAEWARQPRSVLACIDADLRRQGSSIDDMMRRKVYPTDLPVQRTLTDCERRQQPRSIGATAKVRSPEWQTYSLEKRFSYFLETFWVDSRLRFASLCSQLPVRGKGFSDQEACLMSNGFHFESSSPEACKVTVSERSPVKGGVAKSWDGTTVGKAIVGREVSFDLRTLDEALIRKSAVGFELYFDLIDPSAVIRRIAMSDNPDQWINVPAPPLASALKSSVPDDEKYQLLTRARIAWAQSLNGLAIDIPGYELTGASGEQYDRTEEGIRRFAKDRMRTFLKITTGGFENVYRVEGNKASAFMEAEFVATVKAILSQCKQ